MIFLKRFIDDVLGLFKGYEKEFEDCAPMLYTIMQGVVNLKSSYSGGRVEFLDLMIGIIIIIIVICIGQVRRCNRNRTNKLTAMSRALGLYIGWRE